MGKLSCDCLNILIHTKSDLIPFDCATISESHRTGECCKEFFGQDLSEVLLNLEGVCVVHPTLLHTRVCGSWRVHQCGNCDVFTHATSVLAPDDCRILVHSRLIADEKAIESLQSSDDYSPVYKIVLKSSAETSPPPLSIDLVSADVRKELETIQTHLNTFLVTEEREMEERIRSYEQLERDKFAQLQSKARGDKNTMLARLLSTVYRTVSESLSDAMVESPVGSLIEQVHTVQVTGTAPGVQNPVPESPARGASHGDQHDELEDPDDDIIFPLPRLPVARSNSTTAKRAGSSSSDMLPGGISQDFRHDPIPIDDVFQFDPGFQEDPNLPFSESDEDVNDTDDSSLVDDGIQRSSHSSGSSRTGPVTNGNGPGAGFSTSVPIDVPAWMRSNSVQPQQMYEFDDDDDDLGLAPRDPARMAASIQAMARSVHSHVTSEIFGELPKPPTRAGVTSHRTTSHR